ncbi:MAG: large subunit ribosomal protein [Candidatus Dependentiae bacterium]|nr:large subunit ribosomal protein [Candidatus Dependentiae bacterium]
MLQRIKKNDLVYILAGKDKGVTGEVITVDLDGNKVLVKGVNIVTKHVKPKSKGERGSIVKEEKFIALSNVMPVCPETKKPCRVRTQKTAEGKRVRVSVRSGQSF